MSRRCGAPRHPALPLVLRSAWAKPTWRKGAAIRDIWTRLADIAKHAMFHSYRDVAVYSYMNTKSVMPIVMRSPGFRRALPTRRPFTWVPFMLFKSMMLQEPSSS